MVWTLALAALAYALPALGRHEGMTDRATLALIIVLVPLSAAAIAAITPRLQR